MATIRVLLATTLAALLSACASTSHHAQRTSELQVAYAAAAGTPVRSFRFSNLYSWTPLSDQQVAVYTRPNQAWLLDLGGGCQDISYVNSIGLTSSIGQVTVGFDKVLTGRNNFPCTITRIRPIDMKGLKATEQAQRQISNEPRAEGRTGR